MEDGATVLLENTQRIRLIDAPRQMQVHKNAVLAVARDIAERFAIDGNKPLAVLARRFRDELFEPAAYGRKLRCRHDGDLVASEVARKDAECHAETHAGIGRSRYERPAACNHPLGFVEQTLDVETGRCRRHETEFRQYRESSADLGI